jgi:flagellar protein FliS
VGLHCLREKILEKKKMSRKSALAQYSNIDVEAKAASESPSQLITLLFDKACVLLRQASEALNKEDFETFDSSTTHALQIVMALRGVLDMDRGGDVAKSLYETYTSIAASLFKTKTSRDGESLRKLYLAMSELREAWQQIP